MLEADLEDAAASRFRLEFGDEPSWVAAAPGRVNLIGEHVDYVGGPVLPAAIDRFVALAGGPGPGWRISSEVPGGEAYLAALGRELAVGPQLVAAAASLPPGRGLSSSAALLVAAAKGLRPEMEGMAAALACQRAEQAAGVPAGIMDHVASALGEEGHAILLDCSTMESRQVPLPAGAVIAVLDSGVERRLGDTPYADRRREAERSVAERGGSLAAIRDPGRDPRLRHLVTEAERVRRFAAAMERGELGRMGEILDESHASLRDDFEVSTPELDSLAERARLAPGCLGARLMGAGFGGSVLALVRQGAEKAFAAAAGAPVMICRTARGAFAA